MTATAEPRRFAENGTEIRGELQLGTTATGYNCNYMNNHNNNCNYLNNCDYLGELQTRRRKEARGPKLSSNPSSMPEARR